MIATLRGVAETSAAVRATASRRAKQSLLAAFFAELDAADLERAVRYLAGEIPQGRLGVGWKTVSAALAAAESPPPTAPETNLALPFADAAAATAAAGGSPLTLAEVDRAFAALATDRGPRRTARATAVLSELFRRAPGAERDFLIALLAGELRQGALRSVVRDAVATALALVPQELARAEMFGGDLALVAGAVKRDGPGALARFGPEPFVPVAPMLAGSAATAALALAGLEPAAVEPKLDGVRIQLHKRGAEVRIYTRQLRDVTRNVPELAALAPGIGAASAILDGEALVLDAGGRPVPFQDTMSRVGQDLEIGRASGRARPALTAVFFDLLYADGESLLERPAAERYSALARVLAGRHLVPRIPVDSPPAVEAELARALAAGHEGLVVKSLAAPYTAGRRGGQWRKLKLAATLDLVILAAEWGHGRRRGWLSNLHLGARDARDPERFWMLGKTFKGLTDAMLRAMTADLLALAVTSPAEHVVRVRPERVVEIAFDALQRSSRYDSGLALRFARVKRFRPDKTPAEATTIAEVRAFHAQQGGGT
jgi:DNA ligase-1